jgi:hypothetical protein
MVPQQAALAKPIGTMTADISVRAPSGSDASTRASLTEFPLEWALVAAVALIDIAWGARIGFSVSSTWLDLAVPALFVAAIVVLRMVVRHDRGSLFAEYFLLLLALAPTFDILTYLCFATANPLADVALLRLDRAIGFDWLYWFRLLHDRPPLMTFLTAEYNSLNYQALYFALFFGLQGRRDRLREVFWIVAIAGSITAAGTVFLPALGTFEMFDLQPLGAYLPTQKQLRAGVDLHFALQDLTGVISFPSFHTTMALVYAYAFRQSGVIGHLALALNLTMLVGIPFIGGHYLVDMIAGAAVAVVAILASRKLLGLAVAESRPSSSPATHTPDVFKAA